MLDVFVAEASAVLADCKAYAMAARLVIGAGVFCVEGLDWISAFYADWHDSWIGVAHYLLMGFQHWNEAEGRCSMWLVRRASMFCDVSQRILQFN